MSTDWIAERTWCFDSSGIRKVFDLGAKLTEPVNLSIGQPDFDVPEEARQAAIDAINRVDGDPRSGLEFPVDRFAALVHSPWKLGA